jgi:hypothetical protein
MLILEVFKGTHQRKGQKKDGTEFTVRFQEAEIRREGKRPRPIEISVPRDGAYIEGLYTLTGSSFRPDDYDRLSLSTYIRLEPLEDAIFKAQEELESPPARGKK